MGKQDGTCVCKPGFRTIQDTGLYSGKLRYAINQDSEQSRIEDYILVNLDLLKPGFRTIED